MCFGWMCVCWLCLAWGAGAAQQSPAAAPSAATQTTGAAHWRTLSGEVTDSDGALVPGAKVTLSTAIPGGGQGGGQQGGGQKQRRSTLTDGDGHFSFNDMPAGGFTLTVSADGLEGRTVKGTLNPDESLELPPIQLRVAADSTDVVVSSLTEEEVAAVQLKQEEQQRLFGMVPNFYVTYDWTAAALDTRQKYGLAARSLFDPATYVIVAGFAGVEQALNSYSGYGQGAEGYGKRFGAGMANAGIGTMLGGAVFPELFHQDPRYFYKGTGSVPSRISYALERAVVQRGDNGRWQPAYAGVASDFATAAISNLYYPASDQTGTGLTIENGFVNIGMDAAGNLLQEFVLKKLSTGLRAVRKAPAQAPAQTP